MRSKFDEQLLHLKKELTYLGALCETAIAKAAKAIKKEYDGTAIEEIYVADDEIDTKEREIESLCIKLLLQQQPVASDLRQISAALKMITDMERIGDQAVDIIEIVSLGNIAIDANTTHLYDMANETITMVTNSIDAFVKQDKELAERVIEMDDIVDNLFNTVKEEVIDLIGKKMTSGEMALDMLMIAKYFERIGDHATNIAEWVVFSITGEHKTYQ